MKNSFYLIKTAVNQIKVGDVSNNFNEIEKIVDKNKDSSIILFPLLSTIGYSSSDLLINDDLINLCFERLIKLSEKIKNNLVCVSLPIKYQNNVYLGVAYLNNKKIIGIAPLSNLNAYEQKYFADGKNIINQDIKWNNQNIIFSNNIECIDNNGVSISINDSSDIVLNPRCDNVLIDNIDTIKKDIEYKSRINNSINIYVTGKNESATDLVYVPKSYMFQNGILIKDSDFINQNICEAIIDPVLSINKRVNRKTTHDNLIKIYVNTLDNIKQLKEYNYELDARPFVKDYACKYNEIINLVAMGIVNRVRNTNIYNLVIGVSGGLDSTFALLTINKAKEIEKKIKVYAYSMPYINNTSKITKSNALSLMKLYNYENSLEIRINSSVDKHLKDIKHTLKDVTYENAQARYRTYVLMDIANKVKGMVIGTGDLSESALGFCTYNGDHMSMYNPNASLPKTLIKECIRLYALNNTSNKKEIKILESIINTPISPELQQNNDGLVGQKTEDEIGSYDLNDFILYYDLKYHLNFQQIYTYLQIANPLIKKDILKKTIYNFYKRFYTQQFKRNCSSDGIKIIDFSFSPRSNFSLPSDINVDSILELISKL